MQPIQVFARKEPDVTGETENFDVVFYKDVFCSEFVARVPWYYKEIMPKQNERKVFLNCYEWHLLWRPTVHKAQGNDGSPVFKAA